MLDITTAGTAAQAEQDSDTLRSEPMSEDENDTVADLQQTREMRKLRISSFKHAQTLKMGQSLVDSSFSQADVDRLNKKNK